MNNLCIYNSLSKRKEKFQPIKKLEVKMYVCGPTVYDYSHLGHARSAIFFDIIYRYFKHLKYKICYVRNITDIGHLYNNDNIEEDKIIKASIKLNISPAELSQYYTNQYNNVLSKLNVLKPSIEPNASGHIIEQIDLIKLIIRRGHAYINNNSVYFDIKKFNNYYQYGSLSKRNFSNYNNNIYSRLLNYKYDKLNSIDFALWKNASKEHIIKWNSPWGYGYPGWHTECVAMSVKYLGELFDIHGGGIDLIFPHHESEISQAKSCYNSSLANYWIHHEMVMINNKKMSKSLHNSISIEDCFINKKSILNRKYDPMTIRFLILKHNYHNVLNFSNENLQKAYISLKRLFIANNLLNLLKTSLISTIDINNLNNECYNAINNDFNTSMLIDVLFKIARIISSIYNSIDSITDIDLNKLKKIYHIFLIDILGLSPNKHNECIDISSIVDLIIDIRNKIKSNNDFILSDIIRSKLNDQGIQIEDNKKGSIWYYI